MNFEKIQQLTDSIHRTVDAINEQCHADNSAPRSEQPPAGEPQQNQGTFPTPNEQENYGASFGGASPRFANPWWCNSPAAGTDYATCWNHSPYAQMYRPSYWGGLPPAHGYSQYYWNNQPFRQAFHRPWWNHFPGPRMNQHQWSSPSNPHAGYYPSHWNNNWWMMQSPQFGTPPGSDFGYPPYHGTTYPPIYGRPMMNYGGFGWNRLPNYYGFRNPSMMPHAFGWYGPNPANPAPPPLEPLKPPFVLHGPWGRPNSYDYGMSPNAMNFYPPMPNSWEAVDIPLAA